MKPNLTPLSLDQNNSNEISQTGKVVSLEIEEQAVTN